jgi:hypothetical protein
MIRIILHKNPNHHLPLISSTRTIHFTIVIFSPEYENDCGGVQVLFEIARVIGETPKWRAFICNSILRENELCSKYILEEHVNLLDLEKTVILYPEFVKGSPIHQAKHVVRLVLFKLYPEVKSTWRDTDMIYYFSSFGKDDIPKEQLFYCLRNRNFVLERKQPQSGIACMWRKWDHFHTRDQVEKFIPINIINIDKLPSFEDKLNAISSVSTFYCADPYTYWSFIAAFNEVVSIIMPIENMTKWEWAASLFLGDYLQNEFNVHDWTSLLPEFTEEEIKSRQPFGVAWGTDEKEILWAQRTMKYAREQHTAANKLGTQRIASALQTWSSLFDFNK